ncbi:hypothetical protein [Granulicella arctica]|uniref:Uncharacterized protein n=1 Tax=Granulicella arctica TaxID=940613 RepID=A0A7Y9TGB3_9BACT|nr:hypothetical protein [Granulicella arctica]NYF78565.1 hypothetical protein [Granulicella arctica]
MADVMQTTTAAIRAADTLLRSAGGRSVLLRTPSPGTPGDATEQLGLATPTFQDIELAPVVFRKARALFPVGKGPQWELLVSATAVQAVVRTLAYESASVLFRNAYGVLVDATLMEIVSATGAQIFGAPYIYRLVLREPISLLT